VLPSDRAPGSASVSPSDWASGSASVPSSDGTSGSASAPSSGGASGSASLLNPYRAPPHISPLRLFPPCHGSDVSLFFVD
jgi:hypothetical protein